MADRTLDEPDLTLLVAPDWLISYLYNYFSHVLKIWISSSLTAEGVKIPTSVNNSVINSGGVKSHYGFKYYPKH